MNIDALKSALDIYKFLLENKEFGLTQEKNQFLYSRYFDDDVKEAIDLICDELNINIDMYVDRIYLTVNRTNTTFGFSENEIEDYLSFSDLNKKIKVYLFYYIILVFLVEYYGENLSSVADRVSFITRDSIVEAIDGRISKFEKKSNENKIEFEDIEFNTDIIFKTWKALKNDPLGNQNSKEKFINQVFTFLEKEYLVRIETHSKIHKTYSPTIKLTCLMKDGFRDKERAKEIIDLFN
jgi:hypothetical protein